MSKKAWYCCGVCLIAGMAIGYVSAQVRDGGIIANTMACLNLTDLGESSKRAQNAYQHESRPVAIYALTELLDKQNATDHIGETAFMSKQIISIDLMLTHARLAKLYAEDGQTNLSEQHFNEAINCAKVGKKSTITNRDTLMDFVTKIDRGAK
ncbi:MAG: hypothetical protein WCS42_12935 [Verrucomicrobiota bacterium]